MARHSSGITRPASTVSPLSTAYCASRSRCARHAWCFSAQTSLRPKAVRHPRGRPHTAQEPLDHILAAARRDGEVATVDVLEHPEPPVVFADAGSVSRPTRSPSPPAAADGSAPPAWRMPDLPPAGSTPAHPRSASPRTARPEQQRIRAYDTAWQCRRCSTVARRPGNVATGRLVRVPVMSSELIPCDATGAMVARQYGRHPGRLFPVSCHRLEPRRTEPSRNPRLQQHRAAALHCRGIEVGRLHARRSGARGRPCSTSRSNGCRACRCRPSCGSPPRRMRRRPGDALADRDRRGGAVAARWAGHARRGPAAGPRRAARHRPRGAQWAARSRCSMPASTAPARAWSRVEPPIALPEGGCAFRFALPIHPADLTEAGLSVVHDAGRPGCSGRQLRLDPQRHRRGRAPAGGVGEGGIRQMEEEAAAAQQNLQATAAAATGPAAGAHRRLRRRCGNPAAGPPRRRAGPRAGCAARRCWRPAGRCGPATRCWT